MAKKYGFGVSSQLVDLELPSLTDPEDPKSDHNMCQLRRPGVQGLIKAGVLDSFDSLTSLVQTELIEPNEAPKGRRPGAAPKKSEIELLREQKENIVASLDLVDRVVLYCVTQPPLTASPKEESDRKPGVLYVDEIDLEDRMFILQFVLGGTRDLESFRAETGSAMAGLAAE